MSKYSALFEDEDDMFLGSPESKFMDVIFNANSDIVRQELEVFVEKVAAMEMMLEEHVGSDVHDVVKNYKFAHFDETREKAKSLYIEIMGNILSQSE